MARPVQNAAVCRVNSRVDVLPFQPPAAELLQRKRSNRSPVDKSGEHTMAELILETSYPSRQIIRQTDNSSKYKSENEL